jgi:hypothetical protein
MRLTPVPRSTHTRIQQGYMQSTLQVSASHRPHFCGALPYGSQETSVVQRVDACTNALFSQESENVPESRDACVFKVTLCEPQVHIDICHTLSATLPLQTQQHQPRLTLNSTSTEASHQTYFKVQHVLQPTTTRLLRPTTTAGLSSATSTFPSLSPPPNQPNTT